MTRVFSVQHWVANVRHLVSESEVVTLSRASAICTLPEWRRPAGRPGNILSGPCCLNYLGGMPIGG